MKLELIALLLFATLAACSNETKDSTDKESPKKTVVEDQTELEPELDEEPRIDSSWNYYSAFIGEYDAPALLELSFNGDNVDGSYWYAEHGKRLVLKGSLNKDSQKYEVTESYKGKVTGNMEFDLGKDLSLNADWMPPNDKSKKDHFIANPLELSNTKKQKPSFGKYTLLHPIEVYDPEKEDFKMEEATDACLVARVENHMIFVYNVLGHNYHNGMVEGVCDVQNNIGTFKGEEGCELTFQFDGNDLTIEEVESCTYYKGFRAYFGGTLTKK